VHAAPYRVSDRVAVEAVRMLVAEGFVKARPGSGSFVRQRPERQWWLQLAPGREVPASAAAAGTAAPR